MNKVIIVESPSKSKTIGTYLGPGYTVLSSKGHICDLATKGKNGLGIDIENGFIPEYMFIHSSQMISHPKYNPYAVKASNPYDSHQSSSSCSVIKALTYNDIFKNEEAKERREARCMRLKEICEDDKSILSGLIHIAYMNCVKYYGPDAVHKAPGAIYCDINNITTC